MFLSLVYYLTLLLLVRDSQQSAFSSPAYVTAYGPGQYQSNDVYYLGQTKDIVYNVAGMGLEDYTVALWQQALGRASALEGPVVNSRSLFLGLLSFVDGYVAGMEATNQHFWVFIGVSYPIVSTGFSWIVALDGLDLNVSNVFFFWIVNGSSDNQGNTSFTQVSSAYFNISSDSPPSSSITSSTSSHTTSSIATTAVATSTAARAEVTASTSTGADSILASATAASRLTSSSTGASGGGGISTGAGVGIGVGVSLAGACAVLCAVIIVRGKRRKAPLKELEGQGHELPPYKTLRDNSPPPRPHCRGYADQAVNQGRPAEFSTARTSEPVELNAGR